MKQNNNLQFETLFSLLGGLVGSLLVTNSLVLYRLFTYGFDYSAEGVYRIIFHLAIESLLIMTGLALTFRINLNEISSSLRFIPQALFTKFNPLIADDIHHINLVIEAGNVKKAKRLTRTLYWRLTVYTIRIPYDAFMQWLTKMHRPR
jgi:hypothetical protein